MSISIFLIILYIVVLWGLCFYRPDPIIKRHLLMFFVLFVGLMYFLTLIYKVQSAHLQGALKAGLLGGTFFLAFLVARRYQEEQLHLWAEINRYKLLSFKHAALWEGPHGWGHQWTFRIRVQDPEGHERQGWIVLGDYWGMNPQKFELHFDDEL